MKNPMKNPLKKAPFPLRLGAVLALSVALSAPPSHAHSPSTELSVLSMLPVAVSVAAPAALSVAAPVALLSGRCGVHRGGGRGGLGRHRLGAGARQRRRTPASLTLSGAMAAGLSMAAGTAVVVLAGSTGWVLSAAGKAVAYIPNEIGGAAAPREDHAMSRPVLARAARRH
jgi:hypothetical protein